MSATLESREVQIAEERGVGGGGGDVYMVGNWLLSAARVFTQEPLLSAPLMAAVCWAANFTHLSPQPAISTTFVSHTFYHSLTCLPSVPVFRLCPLSYTLLPFSVSLTPVQSWSLLQYVPVISLCSSAPSISLLNCRSACAPCCVFCDSHSVSFFF